MSHEPSGHRFRVRLALVALVHERHPRFPRGQPCPSLGLDYMQDMNLFVLSCQQPHLRCSRCLRQPRQVICDSSADRRLCLCLPAPIAPESDESLVPLDVATLLSPHLLRKNKGDLTMSCRRIFPWSHLQVARPHSLGQLIGVDPKSMPSDVKWRPASSCEWSASPTPPDKSTT